jgi:uncharacterized protein (TIGR03437 family)
MKMDRAAYAAVVAATLCGWASGASSITVSPASLSFSYQVGSSTMPSNTKVTVTLPSGSTSAYVINAVVAASPAAPWLSVAPAAGYSPLALTVSVNPTGLAPSSYSAYITITTAPASSTISIPVTFLVSNPPSSIVVSSPSIQTFSPATTSSNDTFSFNFTTGGTWPDFPQTDPTTSGELDVASNGGTISFNVAAALATGSPKGTGMWFRIGPRGAAPTGTTTSGVAIEGSYVPLTLMLDYTTVNALLPGSYGGTITITPTTSGSTSYTVSVNLVVSAGAPTMETIYPSVIVQSPTVNPMITITGTNFFTTSVVTIYLPTTPGCSSTSVPASTPTQMTATLLSNTLIQATLVNTSAILQSPAALCVVVTNPVPPNNPSQLPGGPIEFDVLSVTEMAITGVTNAASYVPKATQTGTDPDPALTAQSAAAPGEIISIFGRNLGPSAPYSVPLTSVGGNQFFQTFVPDPDSPSNLIEVVFNYNDPATGNPATPIWAPLIMVSNNQINAIVPFELANVIGTAYNNVTVEVMDGSAATINQYGLIMVNEDPGIFTIGGLGTGQAAVLNYNNTTQTYSINSAKNAAPRGSTIVIYATGLGALYNPISDGFIALSSDSVVDPVQVTIGGQPAVVSYAGAAGGSVAGLVQVNAIVPPTVAVGQAVSMTVTGGTLYTARRSQANVTIGVQ